VVRQRRSRLVHDYQVGIERQCLQDLDHVLLQRAEFVYRPIEVRDGESELFAQRGNASMHPALVQQSATAQRSAACVLTPQEDVLQRGEMRCQGPLLIDRRDPELLRVSRVDDRDFLASDEYLAAIGTMNSGEDLHDR
jgi:hypothetical protein